MSTLVIKTDGGARGNPGNGACAFVVYENSKIIHEDSKYLGVVTNNQAEYEGVVCALQWFSENLVNFAHITNLTFFLDSQLVVNQLKNLYKVKNTNLQIKKSVVKDLEKKTGKTIDYFFIPREENTRADLLLNQKLDEN